MAIATGRGDRRRRYVFPAFTERYIRTLAGQVDVLETRKTVDTSALSL